MKYIRISFVLIISLLLVSCGQKEAVNVTCEELYSYCGITYNEKIHESLTPDNSYFAFIDGEAFGALIESGELCRDAVGSDGHTLCVINTDSACDIYDSMCEGFEFPPCEKSQKAIIAYGKNNVLYIKSSSDEAERIFSAFEDKCGKANIKKTVFLRKD